MQSVRKPAPSVLLLSLLSLGLPVSARAAHVDFPPELTKAAAAGLIFEAEPAKDAPAAPNVFYGQATAAAPARVGGTPRDLDVAAPGHVRTEAAVEYELGGRVPPGRYLVWVSFSQGGVDRQSFSLALASGTGEPAERCAFELANQESWKAQWYPAKRQLYVFPGDTRLSWRVTGAASEHKLLDALLLVPADRLPEALTETGGALRARLFAPAAAEPERRIYFLEGEDLAAGERLLGELFAAELDPARAKAELAYAAFGEARQLAAWCGRPELPALLVADANYRLTGLVDRTSPAGAVAQVLAGRKAGRELVAPPAQKLESPRPLVAGRPAEWLVTGVWAGPGGLSLWGGDTEAQLRPNSGQPNLLLRFDSYLSSVWRPAPVGPEGRCVLEASTGNYVWPKGCAYAHLYLRAERELKARLAIKQSGVALQGWLDGEPIAWDQAAGAEAETASEGVTDQGAKFLVRKLTGGRVSQAGLTLAAGWHRLLLKPIMQHVAGETFAFDAAFLDSAGQPLNGLQYQLPDPQADAAVQAVLGRLTPRVGVDAPANLADLATPIKLKIDSTFQCPRGKDRRDQAEPGDELPELIAPVYPLAGTWEVRVTDYAGQEVARQELATVLPGVAEWDLGRTLPAGYYAIGLSFKTERGDLGRVFYPDGFSVIGGAASQRERQEHKKMGGVYYFLTDSSQSGHLAAFPWMQRTGILLNVGSNHGIHLDLFEEAAQMGLTLVGDFWDFHSTETEAYKREMAAKEAPFTKYFKSFNEIDIHHKRPEPAQWVERTRWEYEAVKAARPDGVYIGGSLVRVTANGDHWFEECLKLGLDRYQDYWDVHAYPQIAPTLDGSVSNSPNETELAVEVAYARLGRLNTKPFWLGETGARASHGRDARRWQAETVAKMAAWANARSDFAVIGFLIPWSYARQATLNTPQGGLTPIHNDIEVAHYPAEAALYTASALIDGFPYRRVDSRAKNVQAACFGETLMAWTTEGQAKLAIRLTPGLAYVGVDVVGRVEELPVAADGSAELTLTTSPIYVLERARYERLTAN